MDRFDTGQAVGEGDTVPGSAGRALVQIDGDRTGALAVRAVGVIAHQVAAVPANYGVVAAAGEDDVVLGTAVEAVVALAEDGELDRAIGAVGAVVAPFGLVRFMCHCPSPCIGGINQYEGTYTSNRL